MKYPAPFLSAILMLVPLSVHGDTITLSSGEEISGVTVQLGKKNVTVIYPDGRKKMFPVEEVRSTRFESDPAPMQSPSKTQNKETSPPSTADGETPPPPSGGETTSPSIGNITNQITQTTKLVTGTVKEKSIQTYQKVKWSIGAFLKKIGKGIDQKGEKLQTDNRDETEKKE